MIKDRKRCPKCNKKYLATIKYFYTSPRTKNGLDGWCKICRKKYANDHNKNPNVKKHKKEYDKQRREIVRPRLKDYNMTLNDYNKMCVDQNDCCAICGKHQSKLKQRLSIDHNHKTGKIRGLLCTNCNLKLGVYENFRKKAIKYLKYYDSKKAEQ